MSIRFSQEKKGGGVMDIDCKEIYEQWWNKWDKEFDNLVTSVPVTDEEWSREFAKIMEKIKKANEKEGQ